MAYESSRPKAKIHPTCKVHKLVSKVDCPQHPSQLLAQVLRHVLRQAVHSANQWNELPSQGTGIALGGTGFAEIGPGSLAFVEIGPGSFAFFLGGPSGATGGHNRGTAGAATGATGTDATEGEGAIGAGCAS
jgi:hypothetical protein